MAFIEVNKLNFEVHLDQELDKGQAVVLKFGSEFCTSCFALETELEELEAENATVSVLIIDCDESTDIASNYEIFELPTMVIYTYKDTIIYRGEGVILADDIAKIIGL